VTTIPESVALEVINRCLNQDPASKDYPIVELCHYDEAIKLQGFAAGQIVSVKHGAILRTVFRGSNGSEKCVPIEYRVIPEESDTGRMILLGARTIGPEGLDIHTTAAHREVRWLGLRCERAALTSGKPLKAVEESMVEQFGLGLVLAEEALALAVPEGETVWATVSCSEVPNGLVWVSSHPSSEIQVVEGPLLLSEGFSHRWSPGALGGVLGEWRPCGHGIPARLRFQS
jgi:hypothetical protein